MTTYETIKNLPAKGFDWKGFVSELRSQYVAWCEENRRIPAYLPEIDPMIEKGGIRNMREVAMWLAAAIVDFNSKRVHRQEPSQQTLAEGGFLGGEILVWNDADAEEIATAEIHALSQAFA